MPYFLNLLYRLKCDLLTLKKRSICHHTNHDKISSNTLSQEIITAQIKRECIEVIEAEIDKVKNDRDVRTGDI